jgi:hypothetical protein
VQDRLGLLIYTVSGASVGIGVGRPGQIRSEALSRGYLLHALLGLTSGERVYLYQPSSSGSNISIGEYIEVHSALVSGSGVEAL